MRGVTMRENFLPVVDRESRCIRVVLFLFMAIQILFLTALLLPEDPPVLENPFHAGFGGKLRLAFNSTDAALKDAKDTIATLPIDRVGPHPTDNNATKNEGLFAAESADKNIRIGNQERNSTGSVIISHLLNQVAPKPYDEPALSGFGINPSDRTTTIDVKEEYDFVPFPYSIRDAKQVQSSNAKADSAPSDKETTADEGKPVDPTAKADGPRFRKGWKIRITNPFFKYEVAGVKVHRSRELSPKASPAGDLGGREPLPAMNGLALLPLLDRLYSRGPFERARTATVAASTSATAAAAASAPQVVAVASAVLLLLKAKYFG